MDRFRKKPLWSKSEKSIGKYDLVYTRSAEGRPILLDARIKALANKQERTFTKKQVMSDLK